jgi:hypothetical protein
VCAAAASIAAVTAVVVDGGVADVPAAAARGLGQGPPAADEGAGVGIRLLAQTTTVVADGTWIAQVRIDGLLPAGTILRAAVHPDLLDAEDPFAAFDRAAVGVLGDPLGIAVRTELTADDDAAADAGLPLPEPAQRTVDVAFPVRTGPRGPGIRIRDVGVHPVAIEVLVDDDLLARTTTFLVRLPEAVTSRIGVATVLPVGTDATTVEALTRVLAARPQDPASLLADPAVLAGLAADRPEVVAALAAAIGDRPVLPATYVPVDIDALAAHADGTELKRQVADGIVALRRTLDLRDDPDRSIWLVPDGVGATGAAELRALGAEYLVVPRSRVTVDVRAGTAGIDGLTRPVAAAGIDGLLVHGADPALGSVLDPDPEPVVNAHRLSARLSLHALVVPPSDDDDFSYRGVVLWPGTGWQPDRRTLAAVAVVLDGNPLVERTRLDELVAVVEEAVDDRGDPVTAELEAPPGDITPAELAGIGAARVDLASLAATVGDDDPEIDRIAEGLRISQRLGTPAEVRSAAREAAAGSLDAVGARLGVVPQSVTLTGRQQQIDLELANDARRAVRVRVRLAGDQVEFPEGPERLVDLPAGPVVIEVPFTVRARTPGQFVLDVGLATVDGGRPLAQGSVRVRSTGISGLGIALSAGMFLVLVVWWARHAHRARRMRATALHPSGGTATEAP